MSNQLPDGITWPRFEDGELLKRPHEKYTFTAERRKEIVRKLREYASCRGFAIYSIMDALDVKYDLPDSECWHALADLIESGGSDD